VELQRQAALAERAGGGDLADAGDAAEAALERRGGGRRHRLRAGSGQADVGADGRVVDPRERGDGKLRVGGAPREHDRNREERGGDGPYSEWRGDVHDAGASVLT